MAEPKVYHAAAAPGPDGLVQTACGRLLDAGRADPASGGRLCRTCELAERPKGAAAPLQRALEPGSQDDLRPAPRARAPEGINDDDGDGGGDVYRNSSSSLGKRGSGGENPPRGAPPKPKRDPERAARESAAVKALAELGHHRARWLVNFGVELVEIALAELADAREGLYNPAGWVDVRVRLLAQGEEPVRRPETHEAEDPRAKYLREYGAWTGQHFPGSGPEPAPVERDPEAHRLWLQVLGALRLQVPKPMFETWLRRTVGVALSGDTFTVGAPTPFAVEWLERRMYHAAQTWAGRLLGRWVELHFIPVGCTPVTDEELAEVGKDEVSPAEPEPPGVFDAQETPARRTR